LKPPRFSTCRIDHRRAQACPRTSCTVRMSDRFRGGACERVPKRRTADPLD
jgi:hypothetical protein